MVCGRRDERHLKLTHSLSLALASKQLNPHALLLHKLFTPFEALGRIYIASEGVNAQMAVPTNVLEKFIEACHSVEWWGGWIENGVNIDPVEVSES